MCQPSASKAIEPNTMPQTISTTIITSDSPTTRQVLRSPRRLPLWSASARREQWSTGEVTIVVRPCDNVAGQRCRFSVPGEHGLNPIGRGYEIVECILHLGTVDLGAW